MVKTKRLPALALLVFLSHVRAGEPSVSDAPADAFAKNMLGQVGAVVFPCPEETRAKTAAAGKSMLMCAKTSHSFDTFKTLWDLQFQIDYRDSEIKPDAPWEYDPAGSYHRVYVFGRRFVLVVSYAEKAQVLLLMGAPVSGPTKSP